MGLLLEKDKLLWRVITIIDCLGLYKMSKSDN